MPGKNPRQPITKPPTKPKPPGPPVRNPGGNSSNKPGRGGFGRVSPPGSSMGGAPRPMPGPIKGPRKPR